LSPATNGARRDPDGWLIVEIPATLASGAHQAGEESELTLYLVARALDTAGAGRVETRAAASELRKAFSPKQLGRILRGEKGRRYWEVEPAFLRLRSQEKIRQSFERRLVDSHLGRAFPVSVLDCRARRGAALFAAVMGSQAGPRSNEFVDRYTRVDRKTVARWLKDPVIRDVILLGKVPQWAKLTNSEG
jgi:hypothetical protein